MIKSEELQVGNWVLWKNKPVQIGAISGIKRSFGQIDVTLAHCNDDKLLETHDIKSISPIPLTAEILEKIGFEPSENNLYLHDGIECFYRYKTEDYKIYIILFKVQGEWKLECGRFFGEVERHPLISENEMKMVVKYIHEIQQAMKLCGIKEEIKL